MHGSSRTGLVPAQKRKRILINKSTKNDHLPKQFEAVSMGLCLRPYGGLYNPFAKTCSILCNHPANPEIKKIINQCKQTLTNEAKNAQYLQELSEEHTTSQTENIDNIPEDLFRRYADTDSRPLTPTPTVTSIHTRTSDGSLLNNRRCITPELDKTEINKRKKLILDLRRSHSQETLYWKATSTLEFSYGGGLNVGQEELKVQSAGAIEERKARRVRAVATRSKSSLAGQIIKEGGLRDEQELQKSNSCINDQDYGDEDIRRGKKRKRIKSQTTVPVPVSLSTTTFHLSEDPETQISTLGPDSLNASTRPSLVAITTNLLTKNNKQNDEHKPLKGSFLTEEAFQALKAQLDVDKIENTFEKYLNRALREAYRYLPVQSHSMEGIADELKKLDLNGEKLPRKFSKSATRFEAPMDLLSLEKMSVIYYLSNYVWVTRQRKQLYKKIFLKYFKIKEMEQQRISKKEEEEEEEINAPSASALVTQSCNTYPHDEYVERCISLNCLYEALEDVLQFYGYEKNITLVLQLLDYEYIKNEMKEINFRTWCGIVAFAERLIVNEMGTNSDSDTCDELEKQDFVSLSLRLTTYKVSEALQKVFNIIRSSHHEEY